MSRNVVVSFAEGYSDALDDIKIGGMGFFVADLGGGLYTRAFLYVAICPKTS